MRQTTAAVVGWRGCPATPFSRSRMAMNATSKLRGNEVQMSKYEVQMSDCQQGSAIFKAKPHLWRACLLNVLTKAATPRRFVLHRSHFDIRHSHFVIHTS